MAERKIYSCDVCGEDLETTEYIKVPFPYTTQVDPPSGRSETVEVHLDLCPKCMLFCWKLIFYPQLGSKLSLLSGNNPEEELGLRLLKHLDEKFGIKGGVSWASHSFDVLRKAGKLKLSRDG